MVAVGLGVGFSGPTLGAADPLAVTDGAVGTELEGAGGPDVVAEASAWFGTGTTGGGLRSAGGPPYAGTAAPWQPAARATLPSKNAAREPRLVVVREAFVSRSRAPAPQKGQASVSR
jgi:hypothetical protein